MLIMTPLQQLFIDVSPLVRISCQRIKLT